MDDYRVEDLFPRLSEAQIALFAAQAERRRYPAGAVIAPAGTQHVGCLVVLSGALEIVKREGAQARSVATIDPNQFSGEFSMLGGRRSFFDIAARTDTELLVLSEAKLRLALAADAELGELFLRTLILRRRFLVERGLGGVQLLGSRHSADTLRLREFLTRNSHPYLYLDVEQEPGAAALLERLHLGPADVPVVLWGEAKVLRNPSIREVAASLGLSAEPDSDQIYDFAVVGGGPAGLAASVYAASEGLSVIVLDSQAPGGQAGTSSRIENYLGFPTGVTGQELAARAYAQADKFGARFVVGRAVTALACEGVHPIVELEGGQRVKARAVLIASGASYRKPAVAGLARFEGRGVFYQASFMEAQLCRDREVVVIGGGNSAGQAAVFLARHVRHVHMLVRGEGLAATMSRYLIQRIESLPNLTFHPRTELVSLAGDEELESVAWRDAATGEVEERAIGHVFVFIGAVPNTGWLDGCVTLDDKGFVKTGNDLREEDLIEMHWSPGRPPHPFETSRPGVFAAGDVRSGSVKRVASSVGEGAIVVQYLHAFLQE
jgi:thioredoxin reductase (NADPH)